MGQHGQQPVRHWHTKIVVVSHSNLDGSDRQSLIRECQIFETLDLDHEENNPHDPNAIRVLRKTGEQLGYLRAELAKEIVSKANNGYRFVVFIKDITGGRKKGQSRGVNLLVIQAAPGVRDGAVERYLKDLVRTDPELEGTKIERGTSSLGGADAENAASGCLLFMVLVLVIAIAVCIYMMR